VKYVKNYLFCGAIARQWSLRSLGSDFIGELRSHAPQNSMSKKAQLGKIISGFYVLIFVVVIMGLFILLSTGAYMIKHPSAKMASNYLPVENDLMLQPVKIKVDNVEREMLLFDAFQVNILSDGTIKRDFMPDKVSVSIGEQILDSVNNCYYVNYGPDLDWYAQRLPDGSVKRDSTFRSLKFTNVENVASKKIGPMKVIALTYYYGGCK
jgi:hypothetical protein